MQQVIHSPQMEYTISLFVIMESMKILLVEPLHGQVSSICIR